MLKPGRPTDLPFRRVKDVRIDLHEAGATGPRDFRSLRCEPNRTAIQLRRRTWDRGPLLCWLALDRVIRVGPPPCCRNGAHAVIHNDPELAERMRTRASGFGEAVTPLFALAADGSHALWAELAAAHADGEAR